MEITTEEVLKLAKMSALCLEEDEIPYLKKQIQDILSYAQSVKELVDTEIPEEEISQKPINRLRDDQVIPTPTEPLLAQAPDHAENFFVVPRILEG